jgi:hypothetical protein
MGFLLDKCSVFPNAGEILKQCRPFSCGDKDLDDFQEKEHIGLPQDKELKTRLMYFDLMLT